MIKLLIVLLFCNFLIVSADAQSVKSDSMRQVKLTALQATFKSDSIKMEKEYKQNVKWENLASIALYPLLKAGDNSGVAQVTDVSEIPDPNIDYKLLFDFVVNNPDSLAKELNDGLVEIARRLNLHAASGIPAKRIFPVIVIHAGAVNAVKTNAAYQKKYKTDNPNIKLIDEMKKLGVKFIVCGQSMVFTDTKKEDLLPDIKISVTAQTALSGYQLKGYVMFKIW
jgi:intracellular sulfur oxidation DsrE/DsrF family protein